MHRFRSTMDILALKINSTHMSPCEIHRQLGRGRGCLPHICHTPEGFRPPLSAGALMTLLTRSIPARYFRTRPRCNGAATCTSPTLPRTVGHRTTHTTTRRPCRNTPRALRHPERHCIPRLQPRPTFPTSTNCPGTNINRDAAGRCRDCSAKQYIEHDRVFLFSAYFLDLHVAISYSLSYCNHSCTQY